MTLKKLFTPVAIGPIQLANRIVMPAVHLNYTPEGLVTDQLVHFYVERAAGGVGLIVVGGCPVDEYAGAGFMIGLSDDRFIPGLQRLTQAVHQEGVPVAAQLYHAGRYSHSTLIGRQALAPSAVESHFTHETPHEMTQADIECTIGHFAGAARRAQEAGFDAVEIGGSAGYLICQFLSPLTNRRQDGYGGDWQNRLRFALEVVGAVRGAVGPDYPVIFRLAGNDFMEGGNTNRKARLLAQALEGAGVDAVNVTGGWHETRVPQLTMAVPRGAFSYLAQGVKQVVDIPVISSNRYSDPLLADRVLRQGSADLIAVGRPLIADPEWPRKAREGRLDEIVPCIACNQGCFDHIFTAQPVGCLMNPRAGHEGECRLDGSTGLTAGPAAEARRVLVVGGGPAGMEAALTAAARGHQVTLYEKAGRLGGQLNRAAAPPGREEFETAIQSLAARMARLGVEVKLGQEVTLALVRAASPDAVVVATGTRPAVPAIPGAESEHVVQAGKVLEGEVDVGRKVIILGGGAVGCELALHLTQMGTLDAPTLRFLVLNKAESWETLEALVTHGIKEVTLVEALPRVGQDIGLTTRWTILQDLRRYGVKILVDATAREITPDGVVVTVDGKEELIEGDTVVLALGSSPDTALYEQLKGQVGQLYLVGDAQSPRKAYEAIHEGFRVGMEV
jgi:2,4-dienoyl-CoA reductase (NADPH2)